MCATTHELLILAVDCNTLAEKAEFTMIDKFDTALEHASVKSESWPMLNLEVGSSAWIPYGWAPLVCGLEEVATFVVAPWGNDAMYTSSKEAGDASDLMIAAFSKHSKKHSGKEPRSSLAAPINNMNERDT